MHAQAAYPPAQIVSKPRATAAVSAFPKLLCVEIAMASVPQPRRSAKEYSGFDKQLIAGQWKAGSAKGRLADRNPYTNEVLLEIPHAGEKDLDEAHTGAVKAQKAWAATLPSERAAVM